MDVLLERESSDSERFGETGNMRGCRAAGAGWRIPGRQERRDQELIRLHVIYALSRDQRLRTELLAHYDGFAVSQARAFSSRRETIDDLVQVARIGLIHAVDRFDPTRERPFAAFARATIMGELKRHVRDHTWRIRVPRSLQEHYLLVVRTVDDLTQELGRSPRIPEVAARTGLLEEHVVEAMDVARSGPISLDHPSSSDDGPTLDLTENEVGFMKVDDRLLLRSVIDRLPEREQRILRLRFEEELTQAQIAQQVGVSQMCVSRILARTLVRLRSHLASADNRGRSAGAAAPPTK